MSGKCGRKFGSPQGRGIAHDQDDQHAKALLRVGQGARVLENKLPLLAGKRMVDIDLAAGDQGRGERRKGVCFQVTLADQEREHRLQDGKGLHPGAIGQGASKRAPK